jgi:hydrogenase-1 operon protein HyaF
MGALTGSFPGATPTDVAAAVLSEVADRLERLAADPGASETIDLHGLPLTDAERDQLRQRLGQGEVDARLEIVGPTRITETAYAGVWWLRHADDDDRPVLEHIVVARVPALLLAHADDIADAARRLRAELDARGAPGDPA